MRITAILLSSLLILAACNNGRKEPDPEKLSTELLKDSARRTTLEWTELSHDYGTIAEGQKLEVSFGFKNTGDQPLVFLSIIPSCGCTVLDKPEKPVMPGESGVIKGVFNSAGKPGIQHKTINVIANTGGGGNHTLEFTVRVDAPSAEKN